MDPQPIAEDRIEKFLAIQTSIKVLSQFSVDSEEWLCFIAAFKTSTDLCVFAFAENMDRLQKAHKGKARDTVKAMMMLSNNLPKILDLLERWFGCPVIIIHTVMEKTKTFVIPRGKEIGHPSRFGQ